MKKKIIIICLIAVVLIGGLCVWIISRNNSKKTNDEQTQSTISTSTKLDKEENVNNLHFKYSIDATIKDSTNGKIVENENYKIIVSHQKNKTIYELENARKFTLISTDNINKIEWKKYSYNDEQVTSIVYMYEKDEGTYVVTISHDSSLNVNLDEEIKVFMNNIKFE